MVANMATLFARGVSLEVKFFWATRNPHTSFFGGNTMISLKWQHRSWVLFVFLSLMDAKLFQLKWQMVCWLCHTLSCSIILMFNVVDSCICKCIHMMHQGDLQAL